MKSNENGKVVTSTERTGMSSIARNGLKIFYENERIGLKVVYTNAARMEVNGKEL